MSASASLWLNLLSTQPALVHIQGLVCQNSYQTGPLQGFERGELYVVTESKRNQDGMGSQQLSVSRFLSFSLKKILFSIKDWLEAIRKIQIKLYCQQKLSMGGISSRLAS